ncbi:hypothetical protein V8F33_000389 [Rhypophila sp. PSN 637]
MGYLLGRLWGGTRCRLGYLPDCREGTLHWYSHSLYEHRTWLRSDHQRSLAEKVGWRWIFRLLTILTATYSVVLALFFPETQRKLVGNGSRRVQGLLYRNLFSTVTSHHHVIDKTTVPSRPKHHIPKLFACLPMLNLDSRGRRS